eukprot:1488783-Rhodomonas_salina.2
MSGTDPARRATDRVCCYELCDTDLAHCAMPIGICCCYAVSGTEIGSDGTSRSSRRRCGRGSCQAVASPLIVLCICVVISTACNIGIGRTRTNKEEK